LQGGGRTRFLPPHPEFMEKPKFKKQRQKERKKERKKERNYQRLHFLNIFLNPEYLRMISKSSLKWL
jgi:hypothetical protein